MKNKINIVATILFGILLLANFSMRAQNCPAKFVEKNGLLVIEAENLSLSSSWQKQSSKSGFKGSGYIAWTGGDQFNNPGVGVLNTTFQIQSSGTYTLQLRQQIGQGTSNTDFNDTFFRFPDADDVWGEDKNGSGKAYPKGSGKSPEFAGSGGNNWVKVFLEGKDTGWNVTTGVNDENPYHFRIKFNSPGVYKMEIAARSKLHLIDQIILTKSVFSNSSNPNLSETACGGTVDPPGGDCIPEIKFPGGRIAMSFDGNKHDLDDVGAMPFALAFAKAAGLQEKVVFVEYSNHDCNSDNGMNSKMNTSAQGMVDRFGYDSNILHNYWENKTATTNKFIAAINASSASSPLWIVAGGPMESCWRALNGAQKSKLQYVSIISHSTWNEKHPEDKHNEGTCSNNAHRWTDINKFKTDGLTVIDIRDQNSSNGDNDFNTPRNKWNWLRDSSDPDLRWLHSRDQFNDKFDPSDAGMTYWLITGGPDGGNAQGGPSEARKLLENPCDGGNPDNGTNKPPVVSFKTPSGNFTVDEGYKLNLEVNASDPDGSISNVKLYINNSLIRQENLAPYQWGHTGSPNPDELNGRKAGTYTIKAVATDNKGKTAEKSITMTVKGNDPGNQAPKVSFAKPSGNPTVNEGYKLVVQANATDADGTISNVKLYINNNLVREEKLVPYEWGHAGSPNPNEVNNLNAGTYTFKAVATDDKGATGEASFTLTVKGSTDPGPGGNCTFGTPRTSGIPALEKVVYNKVYIVGTGGPSLSNFRKFTINWNPKNNGVYQFAINTNNQIPDWYVDFKNTMTFQLKNAKPEVTLNNTGFAGLDGSYWVNLTANSFILVSKGGKFSVHFSNASSAPSCSNKNSNGLEKNSVIAEQNPFTDVLTLSGFGKNAIRASLYDINGKQILQTPISEGATQVSLDTQRLTKGIYFAKVISDGITKTVKVIKQ